MSSTVRRIIIRKQVDTNQFTRDLFVSIPFTIISLLFLRSKNDENESHVAATTLN